MQKTIYLTLLALAAAVSTLIIFWPQNEAQEMETTTNQAAVPVGESENSSDTSRPSSAITTFTRSTEGISITSNRPGRQTAIPLIPAPGLAALPGSSERDESERALQAVRDLMDTFPRNRNRPAIPNDTLQEILQQLDKIEPAQALDIIVELKDETEGEERQFLLKQLARYADIGANDILIETFLNEPQQGSAIEASRILTYLDPTYPLSPEWTRNLEQAYDAEQSETVRQTLLGTIAQMGGSEGVSWMLDRMDNSNDQQEWETLLNALASSGSMDAFQGLGEMLNELQAVEPEETPSKRLLREAMLRLGKMVRQ